MAQLLDVYERVVAGAGNEPSHTASSVAARFTPDFTPEFTPGTTATDPTAVA